MTPLAATEPDWDRIPLQRAPRQQRSREKVARALAAASELVAREGVAALTLPRVAEAAGVSVGALYQYLPDRDAIVRALVAEYHARLEALLEDAVVLTRESTPPADPVGHVIDAVAEIYRDRDVVRTLGTASAGGLIDADRAAHKQRMAEAAARLLHASGLTRDETDATARARVAFLAADAVLHDAFAAPPAAQEQTLQELRLLLRRYLQP
ncbi:helix-turn-helix domain-containing protein [Microbacterium sp. BG28]|uniref:TetR/AcrR family transcriptional regulator n=1 Tax=Microbacterium sp. BG28 TaxID=3097356 RepID=UPI002A599E3F|nr:helix-turn-helix domain-containing protein [Microbacterium sp. BG28]MDY0828053.1 helix-turn-helix domain-containing protein [Microbacterium sp. BG28]